MSNKIVVDKNRTNKYTVDLGMDITGDTITAEIKTGPDQDSALIATFTVVVDDAATGQLTISLDNSVTDISVDSGYMDFKRMSGGEPLSVIDKPIEVRFQGTVTA